MGCHDYWSKVTPGNVQLIVTKMKSCPDWESASKKFDWVWKKGEWQEDKKTVMLAGRMLSAEDLEQAERRCRKSFGLAAKAEKRTPGPGITATATAKPAAPAAT